MLNSLRHATRLTRAAAALARHDSFWPSEAGAPPPFLGLAARLARRIHATKARAALPPAQDLAAALESLGPAYVKLGQILAARPDIVGPSLARALSMLQDRLAPFPAEVARALVEAELKGTLTELFDTFGPPVAAASIAQVHRAQTRATFAHNRAAETPLAANDDGYSDALESRSVAVKVLRPGIESVFTADLAAFFWAARLIERVSPKARRLEPVKLVQTLADSVALELDLRLEGAAAVELAGNMRGEPDFRIPRIDWTRTSRRVLTLEWIDGIPIGDRAAIVAAGHDPQNLGTALMRVFLTQALRDGYFHADLHQGNLFVDGHGRLVAVDFGIMGRLDPASRRYLAGILHGFLTRDYKRIAEIHFEAGYVPRRHSVEAFAQALCAIGEPIFGRDAAGISMARLLTQLFETTAMFDMHLRPELVLLQKTMVVVEGVARTLDPDHNLWDAARPVIERFMTRELGPEGRLQNAAEQAGHVARVLRDLPEVLKTIERAARVYAERGPGDQDADRRVRRVEWIALGAGLAALLGLGIALI